MTPLYTIMPDFGGAYAWVKDANDSSHWVGDNCASAFGGLDHTWWGRHPIGAELARAFAEWQGRFERMASVEPGAAPAGGWEPFHAEGQALAERLQSELGNRAVVRYCRPLEDPAAVREYRRPAAPR